MTSNRRSIQLSHVRRSSGMGDPFEATSSNNMTSPLLQDLIREKKASQQREGASVRASGGGHRVFDEREIQSSPIGPSTSSKNGNTRSKKVSNGAVPREMGLREMEEYISKLNTLNNGLKLDLFHHRQRTEALEAKAQKVEELEAHNKELQQINEDLLQELEKRDTAVQEAVALICELEEKVEQLKLLKTVDSRSLSPMTGRTGEEREQSMSQTSHTSHPLDSQECLPKSSNRQRSNSRTPAPHRTPSFLRDDKSSASALRSLYKNGDKHEAKNPSLLSLRRPGSLFSQDEYQDTMDGDTFSLNPRRLSLLSESSFVSVYGKKKEPGPLDNANLDNTKDGTPHGQSLQEGRVQEWIESRNQPSTPSKKSTTRSPKNEALSSIGEVLHPSFPKPTRENVSHQTDPTDRSHRRYGLASSSIKHGRESTPSYSSSLAGPIFGQGVLPPTPGTMSTATLGEKSSSHSILAEKSSTDGLPLQMNSYASVRSQDGQAYSPKIDIMKYARSAIPDSDTDIDVSDAELEPTQLDRPAALSYGTNMIFNGEGLQSIRPARTVSPRDRHKSPQSLSRTTSNTQPTPDRTKKDAASNGENKDTRAELVSAFKFQLPQSTSFNIDPADPSKPPSYQNFASRLFRRNPSNSNHVPLTQPDISSSTSKIPPPLRPSSLLPRSSSHQSSFLSNDAQKPSRIARPGTSTGTVGVEQLPSTRRHSGIFPLRPVADNPDGAADFGKREGERERHGKRMSVGSIGRSASLRIKEGLEGLGMRKGGG